jgi:futalosine hydrolase
MTPQGIRDCLLLVPTAMERERLRSVREFDQTITVLGVTVELCGFGPVAAAAKTARLLAQTQYRRVLLAGIAGSYCDSLPVGSAGLFEQVGCWGIGAGSGKEFQIAPRIGFSQLSENRPDQASRDIVNLETPLNQAAHSLLLTCCATAQSVDDCKQRLKHFPEAVAEDMEGFGVAVACHAAGIPLAIVRGISNRAGDRHVSGWAIGPALQAAAELAVEVLKTSSQGAP